MLLDRSEIHDRAEKCNDRPGRRMSNLTKSARASLVPAKIALCTLVASALFLPPTSQAGEFADVRQLSQDAFARLSSDLAAVTALRALSPGVTLNLLGIDVGVEVGVTNVDAGDVWRKAGGGATQVVSPRLSVHKGSAAGVDIGASIGIAGGAGTQMVGGIVRYQFVDPGVALPSATLRLTGNREFGSSSVSVRSIGVDLVVAKPLLIVTPYLGIGSVQTTTRAPSTTLSSVTVNRTRTFVGFDARLAFATLSAEAEKIGAATTVSGKIGFRF